MEQVVWLIGSLCQLNRLPFDPALLVQRFPAPHSRQQFFEALQSFGFKVGERAVPARGAGAMRAPFIGFLKGDELKPAIVVKADEDQVVYFEAGAKADLSPLAVPVIWQEIRKPINGGIPLGGERFVKEVAAALGRRAVPGKRGRRNREGGQAMGGEQTGFEF